MTYSVKQYAQALKEALEGTAPKEHDVIIDRFVQVLRKNNDLGIYEAVVTEYEKLVRAEKGVTQAEVTLAKNAKLNHEVVDSLNKALGQQTELKVKVDESIIGGIIVRADDTLIDASVKTQLQSLKDNLLK